LPVMIERTAEDGYTHLDLAPYVVANTAPITVADVNILVALSQIVRVPAVDKTLMKESQDQAQFKSRS
jgi:hypothetical protein